MAFGQYQQRVEAGLFEAGRVKQREIKAGADLARQDIARTERSKLRGGST
jgi:hypothetical protein